MVNVEQGSLTALVVDDDRAIRDLLDDVLSESGFSTMCFAYGQPALGAITQRRYDLLVIDIGLPDMNGMRIGVEARASMVGRLRF